MILVQNCPRVQDNPPLLVELLDAEHIAVVRRFPVRALPVSRDANPVALAEGNLPLLKNLELLRILHREQACLAALSFDLDAPTAIMAENPQDFPTLHPLGVLVILDDQPRTVISRERPRRFLPLQILILNELPFRPQRFCVTLRATNRVRHFRAFRMCR